MTATGPIPRTPEAGIHCLVAASVGKLIVGRGAVCALVAYLPWGSRLLRVATTCS